MARSRAALDLTTKLLAGAEEELFPAIIRAIERKNKCIIAIRAVDKKLRPGQALTVSRPFRVEVTYPYPKRDAKTIVFWEHMVLYDESRGRDIAQKAIAHELGHICLHLDKKPQRKDFGRVQTKWTKDEECEADLMALCLRPSNKTSSVEFSNR